MINDGVLNMWVEFHTSSQKKINDRVETKIFLMAIY